MADEPKDQPEAEAPGEPAAGSQETAVGHSVVDEGAGRETAVGHSVVGDDTSSQETTARNVPSEGATEVFFSSEQPASGGAVAAGSFAAGSTAPAPPSSPPQPAPAPPLGSAGTSPAAADRQAADSHDKFEEKPELFVAGAFVGAFVLGQLLKRLTGSND